MSIPEIKALFSREPHVGRGPYPGGRDRRFSGVGRTVEDRAVSVVFTWRRYMDSQLLGPIGARSMHNEVRAYEKALPRVQE